MTASIRVYDRLRYHIAASSHDMLGGIQLSEREYANAASTLFVRPG
jgi:hypothetical protein